MVYYNEIDKGKAEWLRVLIRHGRIAKGEVDDRSIIDVQPGDLAGFTRDRGAGMKKAKIKHVGRFPDRLKEQGHHADLERVFAESWAAENDKPANINWGVSTAAHLLCAEYRPSKDAYFGRDAWQQTRALTQEEATALATLAQWLGTNCGFCWLAETLKKGGYEVRRIRTQ